ncbi:hypothetical protein [Nostocoides sp. HKS02]|uniref:hypothetical protein n=1 Tax=Nostocoides sp. HKS02 TaxID=1813880 RepID=UPI0012B46FF7|nr:hypothetical protein [Tetrasphaera sp. HKS02]QGN56567.1 hypothetical protein GKE56_00110 [Tetrasphaera sp. HKS02]
MAVLFCAFILAVVACLAQGTMDERKLFVLWAMFAFAMNVLVSTVRKRSVKRGG